MSNYPYPNYAAGVVYPIVAYWVWGGGWLMTAGSLYDSNMGYQDFAGSGAVHMVGGCAGLVGAILVGPRKFMDTGLPGKFQPRFAEDGTVNEPSMESSSLPFSALGTLILWVGWYGFNPGSALAISNTGGTVGLAMVNTTIAASSSAFIYFLIGFITAEPDLTGILNSVLGGLVAITANCNCVEPWAAMIIGLIAGLVYISSSYYLKYLKIDDVIDASPVHFFCGAWGVMATALFAAKDLQGTHEYGLFYGGGGQLLLWQFIGVISITAWTGLSTAAILMPLDYLGCLRISEEEEKLGLDVLIAQKGLQSITCPESPSQKVARTLKAQPADGMVLSGAPLEPQKSPDGTGVQSVDIETAEVVAEEGRMC